LGLLTDFYRFAENLIVLIIRLRRADPLIHNQAPFVPDFVSNCFIRSVLLTLGSTCSVNIWAKP
jgi:hypothetical protein